jgi:dihydroorotate dehydrogenase electron transfer subunit
VLPVVGSDGITRMVRACTDGPVFRGEQIRWDDIGTIPFDAFGAPGWEPRPGGGAGGPGGAGGSRAAGGSGGSGGPGAAAAGGRRPHGR